MELCLVDLTILKFLIVILVKSCRLKTPSMIVSFVMSPIK